LHKPQKAISEIKEWSMTTQAPMNVTRRVAMKAGLGTALSALSLSALRADDLPHHPKEGSVPMSHHLDTPLAAQNGQLYIDDLYVFSGDGSTVFIMDVNSNITGVHVKPGFHHEARYEFKVHFDGADFETLTYRVSFGEPDSEGRQAMKLYALTGKEAREDSATGDLVLEGRTGQTASAGGTRLWAGRIADSFYIDLSLLAKVNGPVKKGTAVDLSAWRPENATNSFAGTTVESIVLEVSHQHPQLKPRRPHRRLVRHEARHGFGRLAADQPRRAPHDVADLLAGRHPLHKSCRHQAPVQRF
jgi:hypothetical protein